MWFFLYNDKNETNFFLFLAYVSRSSKANSKADFFSSFFCFFFIQCQHILSHAYIQSVEGHVIGFHQSLLDLVVLFFITFQSNQKKKSSAENEREREKRRMMQLSCAVTCNIQSYRLISERLTSIYIYFFFLNTAITFCSNTLYAQVIATT